MPEFVPSEFLIMRPLVSETGPDNVTATQEATIKKYYRKEKQVELHPANTTMVPIVVTPSDEFVIEGVLIGVIRHCG